MAERTSGSPPLDDVMLAMDVVDTLRHRQLLVDRELASEDRDRRMMDRLREIYASQGIDVPDHVLAEGVRALAEDRFVYTPPKGGLEHRLARIYVSRAKWGKPVVVAFGAIAILWIAYAVFVSGPARRAAEALPVALEQRYETLSALAEGPAARESALALLNQGRAELAEGDTDGASGVLERMQALKEQIELAYELRIVSRPGEQSGVWRIPDINPDARNYYLIVEAVGEDGEVLELPVVNEEDGRTYQVTKWGLRVDEAVFERVAADKQDDGIIQDNRFGIKRPGYLAVDYLVPTTGRAITSW